MRRIARCGPLILRIFLFVVLFGAYTNARAEDFDFDGAAAIQCSCPSPSGNTNCLLAGRDKYQYNITLAVKNGFSIDLSESCFRKRETSVCCDSPRSSFSGSVLNRCPGRSSC